ncbi:MAG: hypothetical protein E7505_02095 [Ruminococcus sp.]|nr:hypothetical protein [Ruminococcus sp.]
MKTKKIIATIIACAFMCTDSFVTEVDYRFVSFITASAATEESGTLGKNITWELDDDGTLTINGSGNMPDNITLPKEKVKKVIIGNGITSIGDYAFYNCSGLASIIIPDSVTSIEDFAFYNCSGLTSITIPDSVTSIGYHAFGDCSGLTSITIPDSVTSIGECAFYKCSGLTSATIPDSVTSIGNQAFNYCKKLTSIIIPDGVTNIGDYVFYQCYSLTSITIPDSVTSIGDHAFYDCSGLTSITIPDSVTSIGDYAFSECSGLTSITIPDSVASIGECAFYECSGLTSITIPDSVASISNYAFMNCTSLTSMTIPNSVTSIGAQAFCYCARLTSIQIPDSVTNIGKGAFSKCKSLTSIIIPGSVTSIGAYAFAYCDKLTSVTIPDSVTNIGGKAFDSTPWLKKQIKNNPFLIINKTLVDVYSCEGDVIIPSGIISIGDSVFSDCTYLTSITIPDSVTSIGDYAFSGCSGLTSITIPDSVTSIGDCAFSRCSGLTSITIPDSVTSIEDFAFSDCTYLTSITIPDSVTSIGDYAFSKCSGLSSITIPDSVTSIGDYAFSECSGLTSITISDSVTSIGDRAFSKCSGLTSITIPSSVISIGYRAFDSCNNLTSIIRPRIKNYSFTDNINEEIILADVTSVKLNRDLYSTYDKITDYNLFGHLDRLQEVCSVSGEIYAVYGEKDDIIMIPKNESLQSLEIRNEGYTFGAATIGDDDYLYVMWGKSISDNIIDNSLHVENIIISKYDLKGNLIDECGLSVDFTDAQFPFDAGNANIEYSNGIIGVLYDTEWTASRDGLHHQGSEFISIDSKTMESIEFEGLVSSHSFGVNMIATEIGFAAIERGDCNLRGINFTQFTTQGNYRTLCFHSSGKYAENGSHQNDTHTYMGGLAKSASTYAITGKSERFYTSGNYSESNLSTGNYDVFIRIIDKTLLDDVAADCAGENRINKATGEIADRNVVWLTECNDTEKAGNVKIVTLEDGSYCVLWEKIVDNKFDSIQYVILDECGNILRRQSTIYDARLSNTSIQPIVQGSTLTWAVSDSQTDEIVWYTVDLNEYGDVSELFFEIEEYCKQNNLEYNLIDGYYGMCGHNLYWVYNEKKHSLIVSGAGGFSGSIIKDMENIENIILLDSVSSINDYAFAHCSSLTSITVTNPECEIFDHEYTISDTATIYGYTNSTAEAYAEKYQKKFVSLCDKPITTPDITETVYGDVDNNGVVNARDLMKLKQYLLLIVDTEEVPNGDLNKDSKIDTNDMIKLIQLLLED